MKTECLVGIITLACNFQCQSCIREYNWNPHIDTDLFFDILKQAADFGISKVSLTGGEPMLHPDFEKICERAASLGLQIKVVTNGWLIDRYTFLSDPKFSTPNGSPIIHFSLDGSTAEVHDGNRKPGSFERVINGVKRIKQLQLSCTLNVCITQMNRNQIDEIFKLGNELGVELIFTSAIKTSQNLHLVLNDREKREAVYHLFEASKKYGVKYSTCTALSGSLTNKDIPFNYTLCPKTTGLIEPTVNAYGIWQFCCDTILDGDNFGGDARKVSLVEAVKKQILAGSKISVARLGFLEKKVPIPDGWYTCEYCNHYFKPSTHQDTQRKVIKIVNI